MEANPTRCSVVVAVVTLSTILAMGSSCRQSLTSGREFECKADFDCGDGWHCAVCVAGYGPVGVCVLDGDPGGAPAGCAGEAVDASHDDQAAAEDLASDVGGVDVDGFDSTTIDTPLDRSETLSGDSCAACPDGLETDPSEDEASLPDGQKELGDGAIDEGPDACVPVCTGKQCGDDGCGGECGTCSGGKVCEAGTCACAAKDHKACCDSAVCWFDSCGAQGENVANCPFGCKDTVCEACVPQCPGMVCGDDGCGKDCGTCAVGKCDGLKWTPAAACADGSCQAGQTQNCDDTNPCTTDACDPKAGCSHVVSGDGTMCVAPSCSALTFTSARTCLSGQCTGGGGTTNCNDGNTCTADNCTTSMCTNVLQANYCLIPGTGCVGTGAAKAGDACQVCSPSTSTTGWSLATNGTSCHAGSCSGLTWTKPKTCASGSCTAGGALQDCNDGLTCTSDACSTTGCTNALQAGNCLIGGKCYASGAANALNVCQACTPGTNPTGWSANDGAVCDDGNPCTIGDKCFGGACKGTPKDCEDGNLCTIDSCDPSQGCLHPATTGACDDMNACTAGETCATGSCTGGTTVDCNDQLACTTDTCNTTTGCSNVLQGGYCLIGGVCYGDGQPNPGAACQLCTVSKTATVWSNLGDGTACGAGGGHTCQSGQCVCTPYDHVACSGNSLFWYDACGMLGPLADACQYGCSAGACKSCGPGYVLVPFGSFSMGSPGTEAGRNADELQHPVTISRGFCLKETEVTQGDWQALMGNNPSHFPSCGSACPVETVSWWEALAYCNALSAKESLTPCYTLTGCTGTPGMTGYTCTGATFAGLSCAGYRLPTEAEWEYAARAGTSTGTFNGTSALTDCTEPNSVLDAIAWFCGNANTTTKVAKGKSANTWGLYDMLGSVWEWCWDLYGTYPTGTVTDPMGATTGSSRVIRGGAWDTGAGTVRAAERSEGVPGDRLSNRGLRPSRSLSPGGACSGNVAHTFTCGSSAGGRDQEAQDEGSR